MVYANCRSEKHRSTGFWLEILKGKPGKPWCIGENNILKDFKETGCEDLDWIYLAQNS
jgi:hypothetical protein